LRIEVSEKWYGTGVQRLRDAISGFAMLNETLGLEARQHDGVQSPQGQLTLFVKKLTYCASSNSESHCADRTPSHKELRIWWSRLRRRGLPIVLRVHTERASDQTPSNQSRSRATIPPWGNLVLVFDTETTIDVTQALTFGSARLCKWINARLECLREYLFHADDLNQTDPDGLETLRAYARTHRAENHLELHSRSAFLDRVLWPALKSPIRIASLNLPFDFSRLAVKWSEGRGRFAKGFSLVLWSLLDKTGKPKENRFRSRVRIKHVDSKRALIGFTNPGKDSILARPLDLRTLTFALTNEGHTLASACEAYGTAHRKETAESHGRINDRYIDYNRRDVLVSQELLEKLREDFDRHPIGLEPGNAMSPASIAKAYLRAMGLVPPSRRFADLAAEVIAAAMTGYYGGRSECRDRKEIRPVVYCDFLSMYPTVNSLTGLWWI
jgi:hypothetical protein